MKKIRNKKGFTLVELLAVIVVLAIVMGLAAVAITNVLENTRKAAMVSDAKTFLNGAHDLVNSDDLNVMLGGTSAYSPSCDTNGSTTYIPLAALDLEKGGDSPYGNDYLLGDSKTVATTYTNIKQSGKQASYVKVTSVVSGGSCTFTYAIYLTDGMYNITDATNHSVAEASLSSDNVALIVGS